MDRFGRCRGNKSPEFRRFSRTLSVAVVTILAVLSHAPSVFASQVTISWDASSAPAVAGYRVYVALAGQAFAAGVDAGNVTSHVVTGLDAALAYRAAVSAYDVFGQEGALSSEVIFNGAGSGDTDADGLADTLELAGCTDPGDADSDDDGLADGEEDIDGDGLRGELETNPCAADTDSDGLQDGTELGVTADQASQGTASGIFRPDLDPTTATDPLNADTDSDGRSDGQEDVNANGQVDVRETNPLVSDNPRLFTDTFSDGSKAGDPSWKAVRGSWSVVGTAKRYTSPTSTTALALASSPALRDFGAGRLETWVSLTNTFVAEPNAQIVFHYRDATHYRYLRLTRTGIVLGQVGSSPVERAGIKAAYKKPLKTNFGYRLRVDIENGTDVRVYVNGGTTPVLTGRFQVASSGRLGYRTAGARSLFDNVTVWNDFVLQ